MEITSSPAATAPIKFTEAEIKELATIRESFEQATVGLGQLEMQKRDANQRAHHCLGKSGKGFS
jgi:hypothetical protein